MRAPWRAIRGPFGRLIETLVMPDMRD